MAFQDYSKFRQEYLKAIYLLSQNQPEFFVSNIEIANQLKVKPPSVSGMVSKLAGEGLVEWKKRKGVCLTPKGHQIAVSLIEKYTLVKSIFKNLFKIQDEGTLNYLACNIEHFISDDVLSSLRPYA